MTRATPSPSKASNTADAGLTTRTLTLAGSTGKEIEARVLESGAGPRVVFLHGLVGLNEHWDLVEERVRTDLRCVRLEIPLLDLTGSDCSIQGVTELTEAYLEQAKAESGNAEPVVLVGNSFGGHVALRIALRRPDLCRGLVLAGSSGLFERTLVKGAPIRPPKSWLREKIAELFYDTSCMREDDVDRAHAVLSTRQGARAMVRLSRTARRNHLGDQIGDVAAPTLLIWGKQDIVTPPSAAQGFLDLMPDARIVWVDRCGHTPMLEAPDTFAAALTEFVAGLPTRAGSSPGRG
ncbi:MAG: alpha/beta hydrolase [Planctomycetota bacterium]